MSQYLTQNRVIRIVRTLLQGALIGVANIIPGVSGGTMAVSIGVYDRLIFAITNLRKSFKQSLKFLLPIVIGAVAGIGALSFLIRFLLDRFPLPTAGLFIGLILGGLPMLWQKAGIKKIRLSHIILFVLFFLFIIVMALLSEPEITQKTIELNTINLLKLLIIGMIAAATMIIPGVSGSLVLMLLGWYNTVIVNISLFIEALFTLQISGILYGVGFFGAFALGILVGIIVIAKIIAWLFEKKPGQTYASIFGLIIASPIAIIMDLPIDAYSPGSALAAALVFTGGFMAARWLSRPAAL